MKDLCKSHLRFFKTISAFHLHGTFVVDPLVQFVAQTNSAECSPEEEENTSGGVRDTQGGGGGGDHLCFTCDALITMPDNVLLAMSKVQAGQVVKTGQNG